jgi:tetratricopeptide (TPR) repeat protein
MFELKPLSKDAIPAALAKAERYRLLNESEMAESICEDVLAADPDDRQALVTMILAVTDQFRHHGLGELTARARALVSRLTDEYDRLYYAGIVCERRGRAHLASGTLGAGPIAYDWLIDAMELFEQAIALRPPGNDDPVLRWNACARTLDRYPELRAGHEEPQPPSLAPEF